ncbi:PAS domain-containing sensor histidine kinase [Siphonobacter sp. BAB-5405]|uniref:PAS domain-containing protein n=1 Tax=Siphonobacter sp. BAB-5405 TaxID=1864825 RepID=UPI000CB8ACFF|nr:PAS domain-containing protein [Siphonobacter sp. BAB-5405]PMD92507.1 PAS domain-containing sensor histidine kinase [Siphonobacter sp. BAB-5405]
MPGENFPNTGSLRERLDIDFALTSAGLGVWELDPVSMQILWDDRCRELYGSISDNYLPYDKAIAYVHPDDVSRVNDAVHQAFQLTSGGNYDVAYRTIGADDGKLRWVRFYGKASFDEQGKPYRFGGVAQDVTRDMENLKSQQAAQQQILDSFEASPVGIALIDRHELTFQRANPFYGELVGRTPDQIVGKPLLTALPELAGQGFDQLLQDVLDTGIPFIAKDVAVALVRNQVLETIYVDLTYQPQRPVNRTEITGILVIATDVTQQVLSRKRVEASEAQLKSIIATAPAAMGLFVGRDLVVEMPNQAFIDIVGKGPDIEGKPLREVMPELENQPFLQILDDVYTSGKMFQSHGSQVNIVQHGVMSYNFYNITYTPLFNEKGEVYAILDIAIDVTESIRVQQKLQETQAKLQETIELAELAAWEVDFTTRKVMYSDRLRDWCGFEREEPLTIERAYEVIDPQNQLIVKAAMDAARQLLNEGQYEAEFSVYCLKTGQKRILHAQGKVIRDEQDEVCGIAGSAQDVTLQRRTHAALELLVQERTEELASTNEELFTSNEELAHTNEQLHQANDQLIRSNASLEQFAYIASHDLQAPLRKIQQFIDILVRRHQDTLAEDSRLLIRIQESAHRMGLLINDLLAFSKISNGKADTQEVMLSEVLAQAIDNLSVAIEETSADIQVESLPAFLGDARQLEQLFQNVLSNAIKFSSKDMQGSATVPCIQVTYQQVQSYELPLLAGWAPVYGSYHRIRVQDNGIGFEEQYADRIFGVFQRLHGKSEFEGTGVGLAICQKVALNHEGFIQAQGRPEQGATFEIYLPVQRQ